MAAWIKMPLGVEVVLDEDHAPFTKKVIQRASLRFFTPQGRHVALMGVKFGTWTEGPLLRARFHPHRCNNKGIGSPKLKFLLIFYKIWNISAPQWHISCAIFTKFAEFVPRFRMR